MPGERLAAARGAVRDGAAAVESFAQLLGSRRVGPRGISRALPEVQEGCAVLRAALGELDAALAEELAGDDDAVEASRAVLAHAGAEAARLEAELDGEPIGPGRRAARAKAPVERPLDARQRLALEAVVRHASRELAGALLLVDLLVAAIDLRPTPLNLTDVLRERGSQRSPGQPSARIEVACGGDCDNIEADPRVIGGLIELAAGVLIGAGAPRARLSAQRRADGRLAVTLASGAGAVPPGTVDVDVPLRDGGPRARGIARAAARRAGIELTVSGAEDAAVTLVT